MIRWETEPDPTPEPAGPQPFTAWLFTGPDGVSEIAHKMREAGVMVLREGRTDIYFCVTACNAADVPAVLESLLRHRYQSALWVWVLSAVYDAKSAA